MKFIGILGGTFDPVHHGHLRPALDVLQAVGLEQVRFLPNKTPPHREQPWLDVDMRRQLIELAITGVPEFVLDERELRRAGPSYMVDTLSDLNKEFPDYSLCLIMGMDAFSGFTHWHRWQAILGLCHLIITTRPGAELPDFAAHQAELTARMTRDVESLAQSQHGQILLQSVTLLDISATQIRESLNSGKSIRYLVPDNVREKLENLCNSIS
ncbi:MAG: nicotinate-nucleotide adenylyltransferase [Gammaproteobacteria bacterium]|nr:nicotinate-nucleotide adenylyltransferase [Gammaproteobacteria bacterium]